MQKCYVILDANYVARGTVSFNVSRPLSFVYHRVDVTASDGAVCRNREREFAPNVEFAQLLWPSPVINSS